jgi:hypothetical protein
LAPASATGAQASQGAPRQADRDGLNSGSHWISRILDVLNPVGTAQAQADEGEPLPPGVIDWLSRLTPDRAAQVLENWEAMRLLFKALHDLAEAEGRKRSRSILGARMEDAGIPRPNGYEPHHIVARDDRRAEQSRHILERFGIDIDDPANGVFLPANKDSSRVADEAAHRVIHTGDYYKALFKHLSRAETKQDIINILRAIGAALQSGGYP